MNKKEAISNGEENDNLFAPWIIKKKIVDLQQKFFLSLNVELIGGISEIGETPFYPYLS